MQRFDLPRVNKTFLITKANLDLSKTSKTLSNKTNRDS